MAQNQKFFIAALIALLVFAGGIRNSECRNVVRLRCIGDCTYGSRSCSDDCKHKGYTRGECSPPKQHDCCCVLN
ncbi:LCR [Medicago truncatula]|uniref:LCR n=1 Tax=Medicago truncatula TaxID=3880 RepID=A0A072VHR3_MEDTR|nr:LCR [Medicago truncatula]